jgi:hypothetical protein
MPAPPSPPGAGVVASGVRGAALVRPSPCVRSNLRPFYVFLEMQCFSLMRTAERLVTPPQQDHRRAWSTLAPVAPHSDAGVVASTGAERSDGSGMKVGVDTVPQAGGGRCSWLDYVSRDGPGPLAEQPPTRREQSLTSRQ